MVVKTVEESGGARRWVMHPVVGGVVGVFAGALTIALVEGAAHALLGVPDPATATAITGPMFASVLLAWIIGAAVAGIVATAWSRARTPLPGTVSGLVLLAGAGATMMAIPHPAWMVAGALVLMPAAAWLGARSRVRRL